MSTEDFTRELKTERMTDLALAYKKSCTMVTGLDLGLFTRISEGVDTLTKLANALSLDEERIDRLLTVCKAVELIREVDGKYVNMSDVERYLVKGKRGYFGDYLSYISRRDYAAWADLTQNLTAEVSDEVDERTYLTTMNDPGYARQFTEAGYEASLPLGHKLAKEFDFGRFSRWLDIAGGSGCYSIAACERYPNLQTVVVDLPQVLPITREYVAKHGLEGRITAAEGNFLEPGLPQGFDLVSFITPLQGYMPDKVIAALSNARGSLLPGGTVLIIDYMLNDEKSGPIDPAYVNLFGLRKGQYLNRVNTGLDWRSFLETAGYTEINVSWFTPHQLGLVTAVRGE